MSEETTQFEKPIHVWFELSYAQYLTIPRSVLQSMPDEWQKRFVECLEQLDDKIDWRPKEGRYWVQLKDNKGHYAHDKFMDYQRGRRRVPFASRPPEWVKEYGYVTTNLNPTKSQTSNSPE